MSNFVRCFDQLSDPPIKCLLKQSLYHLKEFTLLILLAILKQASWICKVCFLAFLLLGAGVFGWILKWQGLGAFYSTSQRIPKMSDYGQCCSTTSEHTFAVNIFCTAQSTSQKLHPHELPDSQEPLHSRHLWHLKIQPPSVIWHTCICNKLNLETFLPAFQAQYRRLSPISAGTTPALPCHLLSALADKRVLIQFLYFYRDFLTTWWGLPCVFFHLCVQAARIPSTAKTALSSMRAATTSVPPLPTNCSSLRGAVIQSSQLFQLSVKASSKPEAITPESSPLTLAGLKHLAKTIPTNFTRSHHQAADLLNLLAVTNCSKNRMHLLAQGMFLMSWSLWLSWR